MQPENQSSVFSDLSVTPTLGSHLTEITKWCRFISIVGIIFLVFFLILAVVGGSYIAPLFASLLPGGENIIGNIFLIMAIVISIVCGVLVYFLFRFATHTRRGIELRNQEMFNEGLKALRTYFIIYGVLAILGLLINVIGLTSL